MKLLVIILNDVDKVDETLLNMLKVGIRGATVIESVGMGGILGVKIPFFRKIEGYVQIDKPDNKTIFTVIYDDEILKMVVELLKKTLNLEKPGTGFMFVVPVLEAFGNVEIINKD